MSKQQKGIYNTLQEGEELIWVGMPCESKDYGKIDLFLLPLSALLLFVSSFFAVALAFSVRINGFSVHHIVLALMLLLVGGLAVYSYFFRFSVKRRIKSDLVYGVTNMRRVLIRDNATRRILEFDRSDLKHAHISEINRNGVGTIYLMPRCIGNFLDNTGLEFLGADNGTSIALFDVEDCKKVYQLIAVKKKKKVE